MVVPWDLDHTWTHPNLDLAASWQEEGEGVCALDQSNPLIATRRPQCDPLLRGLMRDGWDTYRGLLATWTAPGARFAVPALHERLDRWRAQISEAVAADPLGPGLVPWLSATAQLRQLIVEQHAAAVAFGD